MAIPGDAVAPDVASRIEATAVHFADRLMAASVGSQAFRRAITAIDGLGDREVRATTEIVRGLDSQSSLAVRRLVADDSPLSRNVRSLRETAERFRDELADRAAGTLDRDVARDVSRAEERIRAAVGALDESLQTLQQANATVAQQERALWTELQALREYAFLAGRLDEMLDDRIEAVATTDPGRAKALRDDALFAVRRRRRDLLLQLAVVTQGYAALRLIEQDDLEVNPGRSGRPRRRPPPPCGRRSSWPTPWVTGGDRSRST